MTAGIKADTTRTQHGPLSRKMVQLWPQWLDPVWLSVQASQHCDIVSFYGGGLGRTMLGPWWGAGARAEPTRKRTLWAVTGSTWARPQSAQVLLSFCKTLHRLTRRSSSPSPCLSLVSFVGYNLSLPHPLTPSHIHSHLSSHNLHGSFHLSYSRLLPISLLPMRKTMTELWRSETTDVMKPRRVFSPPVMT